MYRKIFLKKSKIMTKSHILQKTKTYEKRTDKIKKCKISANVLTNFPKL